MARLKDKIAVVTGATRGAGKGIALALGEAGATVYVTGRTTRAEPHPKGYPGTVEDTAEAVTAAGGRGIPVRCDHRVEAEIEALFARIGAEAGRVDLLVNNAWGGHDGPAIGMEPFWELELSTWDHMLTGGVRSAIATTKAAVPLMIDRGGTLIVTTSFDDYSKYAGNLFYDLAKNALNRIAFTMAKDLQDHRVTSVALSPGWMRTELVLQAFGATEADWKAHEGLATTESTAYVGRAVVALATDPEVARQTGQVLKVGDLALEYGFTDVDGRQIPAFVIPV